MGEELTPELERMAALVDQQPSEVRQAFQFCIAVAMEEEGAARLVNTAQPEIGVETEKEVKEWVVRLMEEKTCIGRPESRES